MSYKLFGVFLLLIGCSDPVPKTINTYEIGLESRDKIIVKAERCIAHSITEWGQDNPKMKINCGEKYSGKVKFSGIAVYFREL